MDTPLIDRLTSAAAASTREDDHDENVVADGSTLARHARALAVCTDYLVDYAASSKTPRKAGRKFGGGGSRAPLSARR